MALAAVVTLALLTVPAPASAAPAHVWHLAVGGTDAGSCLPASPCATLDYVTRRLQPGDTVDLAAGAYPVGGEEIGVDNVTFEHSGTGEAKITLGYDSWGVKVSANDVTFRNLTISSSNDTIQGMTEGFGYNGRDLTLDRVRVSHVSTGVMGREDSHGITVTDSTFTGIGGAAIDIAQGLATVNGSDFTAGTGIHVVENATVAATGNVFRGNAAGDGGNGISLDSRNPFTSAGTATGNRFVPTLEFGIWGYGLPLQAANNWWGCNEGIGHSGCVDNEDLRVENAEPHLVLDLKASPNPFLTTSFSTVTASLVSSDPESEFAGGPIGTEIALSTDEGALDDSRLTLSAGRAQTALRNTTEGASTVTATLDNASVESIVEVKAALVAQSITFTSPAPTSAVVGGEYTPTATGGASGNPVRFSIDDATADACTIDAGTVSLVAAGTCTVNADQAGDANHEAAAQAHQTFTIVKADFTALSVAIAGTAKVGHTVTAGVDVAPDAGLTYVWKADGATIADAIGNVLSLTADLAGADVTVTVTATRAGFTDRTETSDAVAVANGTQAGTEPTITGTPVVDGTLTAAAGDTMTGADLTYRWSADGDPIVDATKTELELSPAMVGKAITVSTTATLAGYDDLVRTSAATDAVAKAVSTTFDVTIGGTAKVGHTVTAGVDVAPDAGLTYVWKADGDTIADAIGNVLNLTADLAGKTLTVTVTATRTGYTDRTETSDDVSVANGTQTGDAPTVTGTPVVGGSLTATAGVVMDGAAVSFQWLADGEVISGATSTTLALTPAQVSKRITVTATAVLAGYDNLVLISGATPLVAKAALSDVAVMINGTSKAGKTLTATATSTPAPDSVTWEWKRGSTTVSSAPAYRLTDDDEGHELTVVATVSRAGYTDATASTSTATVATRKAPSLTLDTKTAKLRLGQKTVLTWTSARADRVTGDWSTTALTARGTVRVRPTATGKQTYTLTATNDNGTTTATVTIAVALPKATVKVTTTKKVRSAKKYTVRIKGLAAGEKFTVRQGKQRATGNANSQGNAKVRLTAPKKTRATKVTVKVTGSLKDRTGRTRITVRPLPIKIKAIHAKVRASDTQRVRLTKLAKREKVTIHYRGKVIATLRASTRGTLTYRFRAHTTWGTHTISVRAHRTHRTARTTFDVGRRCADGVWRCD